ncbi:hypothetical protein TRFO_01225 [Tritrichomonas foetus]|uniref:Uncharacterized protein n=1 Tax=Tritrichomonas foetus TaxID=1144522 RepID=A0A1J4K8C2_9EUKA|nr:hypothetical protein TRFO_01225 [Tritrichomonas foetus]|eukprot:OHT07128.1 hypothetical protein TRFO_01225 [Tritrichomonas foetus]
MANFDKKITSINFMKEFLIYDLLLASKLISLSDGTTTLESLGNTYVLQRTNNRNNNYHEISKLEWFGIKVNGKNISFEILKPETEINEHFFDDHKKLFYTRFGYHIITMTLSHTNSTNGPHENYTISVPIQNYTSYSIVQKFIGFLYQTHPNLTEVPVDNNTITLYKFRFLHNGRYVTDKEMIPPDYQGKIEFDDNEIKQIKVDKIPFFYREFPEEKLYQTEECPTITIGDIKKKYNIERVLLNCNFLEDDQKIKDILYDSDAFSFTFIHHCPKGIPKNYFDLPHYNTFTEPSKQPLDHPEPHGPSPSTIVPTNIK